jgi:hypothetical protein
LFLVDVMRGETMRKYFDPRECAACGRVFRPLKDNAKTCCSGCRQTLCNRRVREEVVRLREENKRLLARLELAGAARRHAPPRAARQR